MGETNTCPICSKANNFCNYTEEPQFRCWCTMESFPKSIFKLVPPGQVKKACICQNCLDEHTFGK